jgi:hypothetical protein
MNLKFYSDKNSAVTFSFKLFVDKYSKINSNGFTTE